MAGYSSSYASFSTGAFRPFGTGFSLNGKASEPISSRAEEYRSPGDNSSPAGQKIPAGGGTCSYDGKIVWFNNLDQHGDRVTASFAMLFADCLFANSFSLVKLFADEQLIVSNVDPRRQSGQTIRFYDGSQTDPDPKMTEILGADVVSVWPGYVYAVFEDFDCTPYGNRVPLIRAVLSGSVTEIAAAIEQSTLAFGTPSGYDNAIFTVDRTKGQHYQFIEASGANDVAICVIDIRSNAEISRAAVFSADGYRSFESAVALDGSDYLVAAKQGTTAATFPNELALINAFTGEVVAKLDVVQNGFGDRFEPVPKFAVLIESGLATKYLVFCMENATPGALSSLYIALVDVTNGTLSWIVHPLTNPVGGANTQPRSIAFGPIADGQVTAYVTETDVDTAAYKPEVRAYTVSVASCTERVFYTEADGSKDPQGVAYDATDDCVVVYAEDGSFKKLTLQGATVYSVAGAVTNLDINVGNTGATGGFEYAARPGYVAAYQGGFGDLYLVDLSDGTASLLISRDDIDDPGGKHFFDQFAGVMTFAYWDAGTINKVTLGDATPDQVDLVDFFTQVATCKGQFQASDLVFTGFPAAGAGFVSGEA